MDDRVLGVRLVRYFSAFSHLPLRYRANSSIEREMTSATMHHHTATSPSPNTFTQIYAGRIRKHHIVNSDM